MPKLTIVVPIYNTELYLKQCVDSILAQTFEDFTLLLLDDGSTDRSGELCDAYAAQDTRVTVVHQENIGVEQTILKGIRMASTPYIGFVDGDDWILPELYQSMLDALHAQDADMVQCGALINGITLNPAFSSKTETIITNAKTSYYRLFFEKSATLSPLTNARWSKVYTTALLQAAISSIAQGVSIGEDLLLNLAYLCQSKKAVVLADANYYCYRSNENSLTKAYSDKKQDSLLRLYPLLSELAATEGFCDDAIQHEGKNAICSLMLDALLSNLPIGEKRARLALLYNRLNDNAHLMRYANERPLVGKIALLFVRFRLFLLISATVTFAKKVLPL